MCGIAGLSYRDGVDFDPTATARLLLAGLAERGQDATGYAFHGADGRVGTVKDSVPLAQFMPQLDLPARRAPRSCTCASSRRAARASTTTTTRSATAGRSASTTGTSTTTTSSSTLHGQPRSTPRHHGRLRGDHDARRHPRRRRRGARRRCAARPPWRSCATTSPSRLTLARRASRTLCSARGDGHPAVRLHARAARRWRARHRPAPGARGGARRHASSRCATGEVGPAALRVRLPLRRPHERLVPGHAREAGARAPRARRL